MPEQRQEVAEAEENSGMEGRDKRGEQQGQRIYLHQDTQAVVRSGCFLLHSDGAARRFDHSLERIVHLNNEKDRAGHGQTSNTAITVRLRGARRP